MSNDGVSVNEKRSFGEDPDKIFSVLEKVEGNILDHISLLSYCINVMAMHIKKHAVCEQDEAANEEVVKQ